MVQCSHFGRALFPNIIVIGFASGFLFIMLLYIFPSLFKNHRIFVYFDLFLVFGFFGMWLWCWLYAVLYDPGRTIDDLKDRGLWSLIEMGSIPPELQHLPICPKCGLPKPRTAHHCSTCGACHLRMDHHCAVTGQCVADKNYKAFTLSFFYAFLYGISMFIGSFVLYLTVEKDKMNIVPLVMMFYSFCTGIALFIFGAMNIINQLRGSTTIDRFLGGAPIIKLPKTQLLESFGSNWFQRFIPIQQQTTCLAWPDVEWPNSELLPDL